MKTKFRAWDNKRNTWIAKYDLILNHKGKLCCCYSDKTFGTWAIDYTVEFFTGLKDKNGIKIYKGDIITFWLCYETTQTHTGDNIPGGSYTEPDESQLCKIKAQVVWNEEKLKWSWSLIGKHLYQMNNAFYSPEEWNLPIIGREPYDEDYIKNAICGWDATDEEFIEMLKEYGIEDKSVFLKEVNDIEVIGNIHENPELL